MKKRLPFVEFAEYISHDGMIHWHWWRMVGGNGEIMCNSETYTRRADAKRAMRRAIKIIQSGQYRIEE